MAIQVSGTEVISNARELSIRNRGYQQRKIQHLGANRCTVDLYG
jgi:hypothetical protein